MTVPGQYLHFEDKKDFHRDEMMVFEGTAFKQSGWKGSDHEIFSLKWVSHKGDMKLAITYYSYADCLISTIQKSASYLISFNEAGSALTTELIDVPTLAAKSIAKKLVHKDDNYFKWEPIPGEVYVPSVLKLLTF